MITYNKLVRDRIPDIIQKSGKVPLTKTLSDKEYEKELEKKAFEELNEYIEASVKEEKVEELADLLEIIHALASVNSVTIEEIEKAREQKWAERGGFDEKIFLIGVKDEKD